MTRAVAIIGGSKDAILLAEILEGSGVDYTLFETASYSAKGLKTQVYTQDTDWNDVLAAYGYIIVSPHPFAFDPLRKIQDIQRPQVALRRAPWEVIDTWISVPTAEEAAKTLQMMNPVHPLLAIGRDRLPPFFALDLPEVLVRCRTKPFAEMAGPCRPLDQPGPFSVAQEIAFFQEAGIDCLVAHNSGGTGGYPKLQAAKMLGIPVILIDMPTCPWRNILPTPEDALLWLQQVGLDLDQNNH